MTSVVPDVANLTAWMADVERQLRELATGNQLNAAIVEPDDGDAVLMGAIADAPAVAARAQVGRDTAEDRAAAADAAADLAVNAATDAYELAEAAEATSAPPADADAAAAEQAADDAAAAARSALVSAQSAELLGISPQQAADEARAAADAARQAATRARTDAADADAAAAAAAATAAQAVAEGAAARAALNDHPSVVAEGALLLANGRNRVVPWPGPPEPPDGAPWVSGDMWIDTANGRRINVWDDADGGGWVPQLLSTGALTQIVASDVIVQNSVSAALVAADAITAKHTITGAVVQTALPAAPVGRCVLDSAGFHGFSPANVELTTVGTDGLLRATGAVIQGAVRTDNVGKPRVEMRQYGGVGLLSMYAQTADPATPTIDPGGEFAQVYGGGGLRYQYDPAAYHGWLTVHGGSDAGGGDLNSRVILGARPSGQYAELIGPNSVNIYATAPARSGQPAGYIYAQATSHLDVRAPNSYFSGDLHVAGHVRIASGYRVIPAGDLETWTPRAPVTGWTSLYSRYQIRGGILYLTFGVTRASWAANTRILELAEGWPSLQQVFSGTNTSTGDEEGIVVRTDGVVYLPWAGTGGVYLSCSWPIGG